MTCICCGEAISEGPAILVKDENGRNAYVHENCLLSHNKWLSMTAGLTKGDIDDLVRGELELG